MKAYVFDFDGVIVDSIEESLFSCFNAYLDLEPNTSLFGGKRMDFSNFKEIKLKYRKEYGLYCKYRCFLRTFMDLFLILHSIDNKIKIKNSMDLDEVSKKISKETGVSHDKFYSKLYLERKISRKKDFKRWAGLTPVFPGIIEILNSKNIRRYVSTANIRETVEKILQNSKINFNPRNIFDNSFSHDKLDHFRKIKEIDGIDYADMGFIDDQVRNLIEAKKLGVKCFLASWGYNNKEQRDEARKSGIKVLNLKKLKLLMIRNH